jgi:pimeloyl-ACP methyl ester carboxylesterase
VPSTDVPQPGSTTYRIPKLAVTEHRLTVPVDWSAPDRYPPIEVFAREIVDPAKAGEDLPLLLFLQGGPGGLGPRPLATGWWTTALKTHRVVLLDQRGTGRSSRIDGRSMAAFENPRAAADYLACFRQDAIVADAEHLRATVYGGRRWATFGQSYGGFLALTCLSRHPEALTACYVTGGLIGIHADTDEVYRRTYPRMVERNGEFARRYPADVALLGRLADRLAAGDVVLPNGDPFTPERLQLLGAPFGMSTGFDENPLYGALHEPIYHQGPWSGGWAAQTEHDRHPEFAAGARPLLLTGEMFFPWTFEQIRALRPFRAVAEELAGARDWPQVYDAERLAANEVPVAAVHYYDDPYVDLDLALETGKAVGNAQVWVTKEYLHDGLRVAGDVILPRVIDLAAGRWDVTGR